MRRGWLLAALLAAACIDKPLRPSERPDGAPGDHDGGADAAVCDDPLDQRTAWDADDVVRFDQTVAQLNADCFDDIVVPGALDADTFGVFVILGRQAPDFFLAGYDHFIETAGSEPLKVAATDLVGDPPLDLVVFARSVEVATTDEAQVLVFEGVGDGSFLSQDVGLQISDSTIRSPGLNEQAPMTAEPVSAIEGGPTELLIGDSDSVYLVAPVAWTASDLPAAEVSQPFGEPGTQGVVVAPSGRTGENDLVQVDTANWTWFVSGSGDSYGFGAQQVMIDSGPRRLRAPNIQSSTDIASVSAQEQRLSFLFILAPAAPGETGGLSVKGFSEPPVDAADGVIDAVELVGLGGGAAPELLVLDAGGGGQMARVWLFHDVADAGAEVASTASADFEVAPFDDAHPYNRMALGAFRSPGQMKLYVFSSAPAVAPPICWLPDPATGELIDCD
ncbi:MAG TPA: hypothetical protein VFU21_08700 [Kofleriaceae bacterium]|nr:hypothetical protein [Kofleriaceae bacterium]